MSVLTRLFVVSNAVLSIVLAAAMVTAAYSLPDLQTRAETAESARQAAVARAQSEAALRQSLSEQQESQVAALQQQMATVTAERDNLVQQVASAEEGRTTARRDAEQAQAQAGTVATALETSMQTKQQLTQQIEQLRSTVPQLQQRIAELDAALTDVTGERSVLVRQTQGLQEQLVAAQDRVERLEQGLREVGGDPQNIVGNGGPAPDVTGVVRTTRQFGGVPYATISIGRDDGVREQMQFTVIDPETNDFLGTLTVRNVDENEAIGSLSGPRVAQVREGARVRTQ
ncbi:MAG: hypothetical protein ACFCVE_12830 [Phycisphaerae bacterium]